MSVPFHLATREECGGNNTKESAFSPSPHPHHDKRGNFRPQLAIRTYFQVNTQAGSHPDLAILTISATYTSRPFRPHTVIPNLIIFNLYFIFKLPLFSSFNLLLELLLCFMNKRMKIEV
ncbi:uncharacterized protein DS421_8g230000 [Arachis hypogaea]|nr:uncharacterized protein DS421_8g230000 [Arachis hypogaea]